MSRPLSRPESQAAYSFEDLPSTEDFCISILDEVIDKILDDASEKYHEEEVIPWTVDYFAELLKDALDFAVSEERIFSGDYDSCEALLLNLLS